MGWLLVVFFVIFIIALLQEKQMTMLKKSHITMEFVQNVGEGWEPLTIVGEMILGLVAPIVDIEHQTDISVAT